MLVDSVQNSVAMQSNFAVRWTLALLRAIEYIDAPRNTVYKRQMHRFWDEVRLTTRCDTAQLNSKMIMMLKQHV
jgi:hypothetical protein